MGSAAGHIVPGVIFLMYGISWCLFSFWIHLTSQSKPNSTGSKSRTRHTRVQGSSYESFKREIELARKSYIPQPFCRNVPIEPVIKLMCSLVGILVESFLDERNGKAIASVVSFHDNEGHVINVGKLLHITMYSGFFVSGIIDVVALFLKVPRATTKIFLTLAFIYEALLFWFHSESGEPFLYTVHILQFLSIVVCATLSGLRMTNPVNLLINSGFAFGSLLQGTWFVQIGFVFYRKKLWDFNDHSNIMLIVAIFVWHLIIICTSMLLVFIVMTACFRSSICHRVKGRHQWLPPIPLLPIAHDDSQEGEHLIQEK